MEWIKVEDGLPEVSHIEEEKVDVLVYVGGIIMNDTMYDMDIGFYYYCPVEDEITHISNVTHWMYLPEPPKEESNEPN